MPGGFFVGDGFPSGFFAFLGFTVAVPPPVDSWLGSLDGSGITISFFADQYSRIGACGLGEMEKPVGLKSDSAGAIII
jgi:hypothetical protein